MAIDLLEASFSDNPFREYDHIRDSASLYFDKSSQSFIASGHAEVGALLKHPSVSSFNFIWEQEPDTSSQSSGCQPLAGNPINGLPGIAPSAEELRKIVEKNTHDLLDRISGSLRFDIINQFAALLPYGIFADLTGVSRTDIPRLQHWCSAHSAAMTNLERDPEVVVQSEKARVEMAEYFSQISKYVDGNQMPYNWVGLSEQEREIALGSLLMNGGMHFEEAFARLMLLLSEKKVFQEKVAEDERYTWKLLREVYRCYAPLPVLVMQNQQELEVNGTTLPPNSRILCLIAAANRDMSVFPSGSTPDPEADFREEEIFCGVHQPLADTKPVYQCYAAHVSACTIVYAASIINQRLSGIHFPDKKDWHKNHVLMAEMP